MFLHEKRGLASSKNLSPPPVLDYGLFQISFVERYRKTQGTYKYTYTRVKLGQRSCRKVVIKVPPGGEHEILRHPHPPRRGTKMIPKKKVKLK